MRGGQDFIALLEISWVLIGGGDVFRESRVGEIIGSSGRTTNVVLPTPASQ